MLVGPAYLAKHNVNLRQALIDKFPDVWFPFVLVHDVKTSVINGVSFLLQKAVKENDVQLLIFLTVMFAEQFRGQPIKEAYKAFDGVEKDLKADLAGFDGAFMMAWGCD